MTIRVGLIGLGEVAQLMHLPLLADDARYRIVAVNDVSPSLTAHVAQRYGARAHADADALLNDKEVDAVFILTPDHLHADLLARSLDADKHVFIEKPVCLNVEQLLPLLPRANDYKKTIFVGYMRRYARPFLELKKRMPALSEVQHVRVRDLICEAPFFVAQTRPVFKPNDVPQAVIDEGRARTQTMLRAVVGADAPAAVVRGYQVLTGLSSHSFSAMRELLGTPRVFAARQRNGGEAIAVLFDYGHFTAVYEAVTNHIARFDSGIDVLCDRAMFRINYDTPYVRHLPTRLEITRSGDHETTTETIGPFHEDPFRSELDAFHDAVVNGAPVKTTLEDSLDDLKLFAQIGRLFAEEARSSI